MVGRIVALLLRYAYLYRRSVARIGEIVFWPVMNLLVWGFTTTYLLELTHSRILTYLIGAIILWDVFYRAQQSITLSIGEDIWTRNIMNIFIAPISTTELVTAICLFGVLKTAVATGFLGVLAYLLYSFNILSIGPSLFLFLGILLLFGWAVGLVTMGLSLRYGYAAEALIWGMPFLLQPISAVFYPASVLPPWLETIAYLLPSTYVFEGMRSALIHNTFSLQNFILALSLNVFYLLLGGIVFVWFLKRVKEEGLLTHLTLE